MNTYSRKSNSIPSWKRVLIVLLGIIAALLLFVAITLSVLSIAFANVAAITDGTENYTGAQLEAAQFVLDFNRSQELSAKIMRARIESVVASPQGIGSTGKPLRCTDNPEDADYYTVTIKHFWLFGSTYDTREYNMCRLFGWPR